MIWSLAVGLITVIDFNFDIIGLLFVLYWVTQKEVLLLIKHRMHIKRQIFETEICLDYQ